jgi:hypothetical protein
MRNRDFFDLALTQLTASKLIAMPKKVKKIGLLQTGMRYPWQQLCLHIFQCSNLVIKTY